MFNKWTYALVVLALFMVLVAGVPLAADVLANEVWGQLNYGMLIFLIMHVLTPLLAFAYLRQRRGDS